MFFLAVWIDPQQPVRSWAVGYALLFGYLLFAVAVMVIAWRSWWWDHCCRVPVLLIDISAFLAAVFFTEGVTDDFTSPFLAYFAFLMLSATLHWGWKATLITGLSAAGLYLLVGLAMKSLDIDLNIYRFSRRVIYMLILALILAWFGLQRRERSLRPFIETAGPAAGDPALMQEALKHALSETGAQRGVLAWAAAEEPDILLVSHGVELPSQRIGPSELDPDVDFAPEVRVFDSRRSRMLRARTHGPPSAHTGLTKDRLAHWCGLREGLAVPLASLAGQGELVLCDIEGLGSDHVELGRLLARDISAAFDRHAALALASEQALGRMRDALARDLHDSVAQSLAGASLRLEGLRKWISDGGDPEPEIDAMKASLRNEQRHVRMLITRLRDGMRTGRPMNATSQLGSLVAALGAQWGVTAQVLPSSQPAPLTGPMAHEIEQLLREAIANAVRHGQAAAIDVELRNGDDWLTLRVCDNGRGFAPDAPLDAPRSISERVRALGGSLTVDTGDKGTQLLITLPVEDTR